MAKEENETFRQTMVALETEYMNLSEELSLKPIDINELKVRRRT